MDSDENYIELNRKFWNSSTQYHLKSEFYDMEGFVNGRNSLNNIESVLLGNVQNKNILHLQCHFGQDTLSLARMGAKVTGVDFSDKAIENAIKLNTRLNLDAEFICCDLYDLPLHLNGQFDIIYTSYGTIGWLPDLNKWAKLISDFLKPAGQFVFVEFHPVVWMFDNNFTKIDYNYFNEKEIIETSAGTYAYKKAPLKNKTISWNHSLGEVMGSLITNGLRITHFKEYNYSPYNCLNNMEKISENKFQIKDFGNKIPLLYSLTAVK